MFAKFDEILSMIRQDIKETKRYGRTVGLSFGRTDGRTDNMKTVYPPTNIVCGGYKEADSCEKGYLLQRHPVTRKKR